MIELRTGVPGSGKTLSMVAALASLFKRWGNFPEEARPVFQLGIPDLVFPVAEVPLKSVQVNKAGSPSLVPDWDAMPEGSLVIIDEAQGVFPPRSSASMAPAHVAWLNTHRHKGFDIWLTTQHPKLIDGTVRALVGKHQHYRRLFGGQRAICYEWDACSDSLSGLKQAVTSYFPYPRKAFQWYKSAEIHTKQSYKLPSWLLLPVVGVLLMLFFMPKAYSIMFGDHKKQTQEKIQTIAPESTAKGGALAPTAAGLTGFPIVGESAPAAAPTVPEKRERTPEELRLADGVYGDDPKQPAHFTDEQLRKQAQNVALLDAHEADGLHIPMAPREPVRLPTIFHDAAARYADF